VDTGLSRLATGGGVIFYLWSLAWAAQLFRFAYQLGPASLARDSLPASRPLGLGKMSKIEKSDFSGMPLSGQTATDVALDWLQSRF